MYRNIKKLFKKDSYKNRTKDIDPDEIFIDSENLPNFDVHQFEGRIEKPISIRTFFFLGIVFVIIFLSFFWRSWYLQVSMGPEYFDRSENNRLRHTLIFAKRGVILDKNNKKLAWNVFDENNPEFALRKYETISGLSHIVGYLKYPSKDKYGFYYSDTFIGKDGVEKFYNTELSGENGLKILEINALGKTQSESVLRPPEDGKDIKLSVDSDLSNAMYAIISNIALTAGYTGGAAVIMDVNTGEILSLVSYPEYNQQVLTDGKDNTKINRYIKDKDNPFLDRIVDGLYTPGSIVKPFMAVAALAEKIIGQYDNILSTGSISLPNQYDPSKPSVFKDWKAHGYVDMREALAVSSDVYFYEIGGGYENQKGLGIDNIKKYMQMFGFGSALPNGFFNGTQGTLPDPAWKAVNFNGDDWRIGDTYHTSIGQYGFQVSPIQTVRAVASIANGGKLLEPTIIFGGEGGESQTIPIDSGYFQVAREGMKMAVDAGGTATGLQFPEFSLGAKTGTAELGSQKQFINAWVIGFFPYEKPKYAFALIMEKGPVHTTYGGVYPMRQIFEWIYANRPEYLQ
ncbi:MAG: penicillin-binding transpeptidase domain-containing protein [Candidatus Paceibacterota bacterium]|jgi:penicillin-binding protein 2